MYEAKVVHPTNFYSLFQKIGSGSYGNVYKAKRNSDGVTCALKCMSAKSGFDLIVIRQEVNTLIRCRHPNVVEFYEVYLYRRELWISMEFCDGGPLNDIVNELKSLEEVEIAYILKCLMEGLRFIHLQKNIHRDIKGANILMTLKGNVKIADFGVAGKLNGTLDKRRSIIGSPYWMAPEVITAKSTSGYNSSCDIWSAGIFAIELAECTPPLYKVHPMDALSIIARNSYLSPTLKNKEKWSPEFKNFVAKCLKKNFKTRPTAEECLSFSFLSSDKLTIHVGLSLVRRFRKAKYGIDDWIKEDEDKENEKTLNYSEAVKEGAEDDENSSDDTIADETNDFYDHFPPERTELTAEIVDWRKYVQSSKTKSEATILGAYLKKVSSDVKLPQVLGADYWENTTTDNMQKILLATESGLYMNDLGKSDNFELVIPQKVIWVYVNKYNFAIVLGCIKNRDLTVYQFDLNAYFIARQDESHVDKKFWLNFAKELDSIDRSHAQKCVAFFTVKKNSEGKQFFSDFLIVKCLERIILFRWYSQGRRYAYVKEHSTPLYQTPVLSPIVLGIDPYPFCCFGAKKKDEELKNIEFSGVNFNSNSNWFANFIEETNHKSLQFRFMRQTNKKIILGFHDYALIYSEDGNIIAKITFDKIADDFAVVNDELLIVHKNGIIMKNFENEVTQIMNDYAKTFRLLSSNGILIFETSQNKIKDIFVLVERQDI